MDISCSSTSSFVSNWVSRITRLIQDLPHASPTWANQQGYSCEFAQHTEKGTQKSIKSLKIHNGKKGDSQFQVTVTGGLDSDILQHKDALKLAYYNRHTAPEQELNISKKMIRKYSHWLHLFDLSPLCVFKCLLKLYAFEDAMSHWLHLFSFSPMCLFSFTWLASRSASCNSFPHWLQGLRCQFDRSPTS